MKINNLGGRLLVYIAGLFFITLGSNLSIISELGVSPVNSVPYAVSLVTKIPLSSCVMMVYSFYIFLQIVILRKDFKIINLAQIICSMMFGYFVGVTGALVSFIKPENYLFKLVLIAISVFFVALGVSLYMGAKLINLPAEGLTSALAFKLPKIPFHIVKIIVDCTFVTTAALISLVFFKEITGVREGTVIAAIFVGKVMPFTNKIAAYPIAKFCNPKPKNVVENINTEVECS